MKGAERTAEAVRRTIGSGQARLYRDLAAVLGEAPPGDRAALGALILDAHCGDFDPYRAPDGDPAGALRLAIADAEVTPATRMLLDTVLAQHLAGDYQAADDAELWVRRLLARYCPAPRAVLRPRVIAVPLYRGKVTPRLAEVYERARAGIERGTPPTSSEIAAAIGRPAGDVRAAISNLIALGLLVEVGADRALELGAVDA